MSITLPSEDELRDTWIALLQAASQQIVAQGGVPWDLSDKSFHGLYARASAQAQMLLLDGVADADADSVPAYKQDADGTLLSRCSPAALDAWAITFGLPSGAPGLLGRKGAIGSSGGAGTPTCTIGGTLIPAGSQLVDSTGQVTVQTTAAITTDGPPNTVAVSLASVTTGVAANLPAGNVLTWVAPPAGVSATLTLTTGLSGAVDREADGALLARLLFRIQNPPRGGTAADYRYWAEASTDEAQNDKSNNILRAWVYPLRSGVGSVDVVLSVSGSGTTRAPAAAVVAAAQTYLDSVRPVTATVNAMAPSMTAAIALRVRVVLLAHAKYAPDWLDGGAANIIDAYNLVGTPKVIQLRSPAPALKAAVDLGQKPRVQIICSAAGASVLPYQLRVVGYTVGPPDEITLEGALPDGLSPVIGTDYLYAGGPYVDTIAAALLAYANGLGPSRASGFADEFDPWEYEFTPARVADIVMEARDTDGTRMIRDIPNLGTTGIVIAVGAGAFGPAKFTPRDIGSAPELAYLRAGGIEIVGGV